MSDSENYLRYFARSIDESYEDLIKHATDYVKNGRYWCIGEDASESKVPDEFWEHFKNVTEIEVKEDDMPYNFFRCAC